MSDSFADLWASSAPAKSNAQQPQKKVGSTVPQRRQQYDAFSILSASQPSSRPVANNQFGDRQGRQYQATSHGQDAFSDLFPPSLDGTAAGQNPVQINMSMAERAVLAQKAKVAQNNIASPQIEPPSSSASLWDGLDALARPTTASPRPPVFLQENTSARDSFDFEFDSLPAAGTVPSVSPLQNNASIDNGDWGLHEFNSESRSAPAPTKPVTGPSLLGGDTSDAEDTFNIRSGYSGHPEDDILGDLSKPVSQSHSPSPNTSTSARGPVRSPPTSASPPPHITGQLVEMGFSPIDARAALVNTMTENGFDVQIATELLLSQADQEGSARSSPHLLERERRDRDRAVRPPITRTDSHARPPNPSEMHPQSQPQLDITTEKLLSQASEIGRGMFSKANALWKEGKERAVKMYEERAAGANVANGAPASDGRPRWMRDRDHGGEWQRPDRAVQAGFKDNEDEEQGKERRERQHPPARRPPQSQLQSQSQPSPPQPEREQEVDLFSADSPTAYQSPFRRGKSEQQGPALSIQSSRSVPIPSTQTPVSTSGASTSQRSPQPRRTFTTTIALSALSMSTSHKSAGTDAYKRGDFPVALAAYMHALSALPPGHVLRVPILANVALVRSKVGELRETIRACEEAVGIVRWFVGGTSGVGSGGVEMSFTGTESDFDEKTPVEVGTGKVSILVQDGNPTSNGNLPTSVDLVEGLSKAFRRRAEALEGLEKWETARCTWEVLFGAEWAGAGVKGEAAKGMGRCRRMVDAGDAGGAGLGSQHAPSKPKPNSTPHPRPKPKIASRCSASPPPSAALTALRSTHSAQQTEEAARLACKDAVDARLTAWKSGREGNIRALLTSLDETILWPELGWRKVGMAEVVSKGQVKGAYVRAIAKVHPDKLNAGNTTVEQRTIANEVFGALNEAWNVFQQQQQ